MNSLKQIPTSAYGKPCIFAHPSLTACTNVFVRHNSVRKFLQSPYDGLLTVVQTSKKIYTIDMNSRETVASTDRLKSTFLEASDFFTTTPIQQLLYHNIDTEQPSKTNASTSRHDPKIADPLPKTHVTTHSVQHIRYNMLYL